MLELSPHVRQALAERDIAALYRALQAAGVPQRVIAACAGQSQSEVSEILHGRKVQSVEVLQRIVDGLGISRATIGLAEPDGATGPVPVPTIVLRRAKVPAPWPVRKMTPLVESTVAGDPPRTAIVDVTLWTSRAVWALRSALRHGAADFGKYLGVSSQLVTKWEGGAVPTPFHQSLLDTALARADEVVQARFARLAGEMVTPEAELP